MSQTIQGVLGRIGAISRRIAERVAPGDLGGGGNEDMGHVLVVAASHGFPSTKARYERPAELVQALTAAGHVCDLVVLCERVLQPAEEDSFELLRSWARKVELIPHPSIDSRSFRFLAGLRQALSLRQRLGGRGQCPKRLLGVVRAAQAREDYRAVIVLGAHLAPVLGVFPAWTERFLDPGRLGFEAHEAHEHQGRADVLEVYGRRERELQLLGLADGVLLGSREEAVRLRSLGFSKELLLAPPTGSLPRSQQDLAEPHKDPIRPPRILCVGSDTPANLDAIRWFRRQVFPRIARAVPTCRLRLVGEMARHIEPGPSVDRIGWVDRLEEEYRDAAVVVLPLRMGAGVRRRAVEALARNKALATTRVGGAGLGLQHLRDGVMTDDVAELGAEIIRILSSDAVRQAYERRGGALASASFSLERALSPLCERLEDVAPSYSSPRNSFMCVS